MIWVAAGTIMATDEALGRRLIVVPLACWFAADSLGSVLAGAWMNAVFNAAILASFAVALFWGRG